MPQPLEVFIAYAYEDAEDIKELDKKLAVMKSDGLINIWHDAQITPGEKWRKVIQEKLAAADIVLYLVSNSSLTSEAYNEEFSQALTKNKIVIPIILKACDWRGDSTLGEIQVLPQGGKPVHLWKNKDEAWQNVVNGIRKAIKPDSKPVRTEHPTIKPVRTERPTIKPVRTERPTIKPVRTEHPTKCSFDLPNMLFIFKLYGDASNFYEEIINHDPSNSYAYRKRGIAKKNLKDWKGAIKDYDRAIELNPDYAEAYNSRGTVKKALGDWQDALKDYNKAIKLNPNYAEAYHNRGTVKLALGDRQGALEDFKKAHELDPTLTPPINTPK